MKQARFRHEVVGSIPEVLKPATLYVTTDSDVAGHLCACGCGREVITPLSPTDWSLSFDQRGATLYPSIGNWAFPCRSHYFISNGAVVWARDMSDKAVAQGRRRDKARKQRYYEMQATPQATPDRQANEARPPPPLQEMTAVGKSNGKGWLAWCRRFLSW